MMAEGTQTATLRAGPAPQMALLCRRRPAARRALLSAALLLLLAAASLLARRRLGGADDTTMLVRAGHPVRAARRPAPSPAARPAAAATGRPRSALLAVRTSGQHHGTRLPPLVASWLKDAQPGIQIQLFSDNDAVKIIAKSLPGVLAAVSRGCGQSHSAATLCCRLAHEIATFLDTKHAWWCHFDDDNYVNTPALAAMLASYDSRKPWYLGREHTRDAYQSTNKAEPLRFATGGAGFCLSRAAVLQAKGGLLHGQFESSCQRFGMPDDVTLGRLLSEQYRIRVTYIEEFHSHLEQLSAISQDDLKYQVTLSYSLHRDPPNTIKVPGLSVEKDPTRFRSLYCFLHGKNC